VIIISVIKSGEYTQENQPSVMVVTVVVDLVVGTGQDKDLSALIIAVSIGKLMMQDILYFHL
jgi:hypothetical protein